VEKNSNLRGLLELNDVILSFAMTFQRGTAAEEFATAAGFCVCTVASLQEGFQYSSRDGRVLPQLLLGSTIWPLICASLIVTVQWKKRTWIR
jgi:hypothetical protein